MKIAFVRRAYRPEGGVEKLFGPLMEKLRARGHEIHLLAEEWPDNGQFTLVRVPNGSGSPAARLTRFEKGIRELLAAGGFDLVFGCDRVWPTDIFRAGQGLHRALLAAMAPTWGSLSKRLVRVGPSHRALLALEKEIFAAGHYRRIIANSLRGKFEIVRTYGVPADRVQVIYNGVDLARFSPRERHWWRPETRRLLDAGDDLAVLFVGSDFERQGLEPAVRALAAAFPAGGARLVAAGDGGADRYRMLAHRLGVADRVTFLGRVDVIERFYAAADVLVHPALYDPFPNAILEALACGVPVITTPGCGGAEAIEDGKSGYIAENLSQLVDGLKLIAESGRRAEMGDLARRRAQQFSLDLAVERTLKVIEDVLAEKA